jgi:hypothetical protein
MLFFERRSEFQGACDPIFGTQPALGVDLKAWVLIIPNIGSRCWWEANHLHIAFQKITCPSDKFSADNVSANTIKCGQQGKLTAQRQESPDVI